MPFGFTQYLEDHGKSQETIEGYIKTINMFFHFIDETYGKQKEIHQINPKDIKDFLQSKLDTGNEVTTVNKHLTILKRFFDYLWQQGKAPVDPAMKIKSYKGEEEKANTLTYEMLLDILPYVLKNPEYPALRKTIFILALKGIRNADFRIPKSNVFDKGDTVDILLRKHTISLQGEEADVFLQYFFEAQFNGSAYIFTTKKRDGSLVAIELMSIYTHLNAITADYGLPNKLTLNGIRHAYAYYLYTKKRWTIEEIAFSLGIESNSAANLIKVNQERYARGQVNRNG